MPVAPSSEWRRGTAVSIRQIEPEIKGNLQSNNTHTHTHKLPLLIGRECVGLRESGLVAAAVKSRRGDRQRSQLHFRSIRPSGRDAKRTQNGPVSRFSCRRNFLGRRPHLHLRQQAGSSKLWIN